MKIQLQVRKYKVRETILKKLRMQGTKQINKYAKEVRKGEKKGF